MTSDYIAHTDFAAEPEHTLCMCDSCSYKCTADMLCDIEACYLTPGDPSPAGRCPECNALSYVIGTTGTST